MLSAFVPMVVIVLAVGIMLRTFAPYAFPLLAITTRAILLITKGILPACMQAIDDGLLS